MRETYHDVLSLPELVAEGRITRKEALNFIAEDITRNPFKFGITGDAKEVIGDLYFAIMKNGGFLFDNYRKEYGTFKTYLCSFIRFQLKSVKRQKFREYAKERTFAHVEETEYEMARERYEQNEFDFKIMRFKPHFISREESAPFLRKRSMPTDQVFSRTEKRSEETSAETEKEGAECVKTPDAEKNVLSHFSQSRESSRKLALVLALKSCYYLSEETLDAISDFCKIERRHMAEAVASLRKTLGAKIKKYESLKNRRDYSYFQRRKCFFKLQLLKMENSSTEEMQRLYDFHSEKWNSKNSHLQNESYKVCPTNKAIAELLGICERQVGYYINKAEDILKIREKDLTER